MRKTLTSIEGVFIIEPNIFKDNRGSFFEFFCDSFFKTNHLNCDWYQDNIVSSKKGAVRGLHFQKEPYAQIKLVSVLKGKVFDVIVDLRKKSKTFGKCFSMILTEENNLSLYIPSGCAHGIQSLEDNSLLIYKSSVKYMPEFESGIFWNDQELNVSWPIHDEITISEKDRQLMSFKEFKK